MKKKIFNEYTPKEIANSFPLPLNNKYQIDRRTGKIRIQTNITDSKELRLVISNLLNRLDSTDSYYWVEKEYSQNSKIFQLIKSDKAIKSENTELSSPEKIGIQMLKDWLRLLHSSEKEKKEYKGYLSPGYYNLDNRFSRILEKLDTSESYNLVFNGYVKISSGLLTQNISSYKNKSGKSETNPSIQFGLNDQNGDRPWTSHQFTLFFSEIDIAPESPSLMTSRPVLDTMVRYDQVPFKIPSKFEGLYQKEDIYDLSTHINNKNLSVQQKNSIGYIIGVLSELSGIKFISEIYYKYDQLGNPINLSTLKTLKGTLKEILNTICQLWEYNCILHDKVYYFWPKTWAQDRSFDVSDEIIESWKNKIIRNRGISNDIHLEMAKNLTWPQYRVPISIAIPNFNPVSYKSFQSLKVVGKISNQELNFLTKNSVLFTNLSINTQQIILSQIEFWRLQYTSLTISDIRRGFVSISPSNNFLDNGKKYITQYIPTSLSISDQTGNRLWP
jgi:hypothetical protein